MMQRCEVCGGPFDDAISLTYCPHDALADPATLARKDVASGLLGKIVRFRHQAGDGPDHRITSVDWHGMVTLLDLPGQFAPDLFVPAS